MKFTRPQATLPNLINLIGAVVVVYLIIVLAQTVKRNYDLGVEANQLRAESTQLQTQNDELKYNIQYYATNSFREREARAKLGLQLPGESVVIIPQASPTPTPPPDPAEAAKHNPSHFSQWLNFLLGRS